MIVARSGPVAQAGHDHEYDPACQHGAKGLFQTHGCGAVLALRRTVPHPWTAPSHPVGPMWMVRS